MAEIVAPGTAAEDLPWQRLRFEHVQAVKVRLADLYTFTTANRALTAVRGVLRMAFNLDRMSAEA